MEHSIEKDPRSDIMSLTGKTILEWEKLPPEAFTGNGAFSSDLPAHESGSVRRDDTAVSQPADVEWEVIPGFASKVDSGCGPCEKIRSMGSHLNSIIRIAVSSVILWFWTLLAYIYFWT